MSRFAFIPLALVLTFSFVPTEAWAAKSADAAAEIPNIEATGITAFDSIFMKVKAIHDTLDSAEGRITGAQDEIAAALGLPAGTPLRMSMWELKQKAGGPVGVDMAGGKPKLTIGGEGSAEAKAAVQAVDKAVISLVQVPKDLAALPAQMQELVAACQQFPGQLNPQLLAEAGLKPLELPKVAKTLGKNVKATVKTPGRIDALVQASKDMITGIPDGLKATEAPTVEAVAASKADKKKDKAAKKSASTASTATAAAASGTGDLELPADSILGPTVTGAWAAFNDAEVGQAKKLLGDAEAQLFNAKVPLSSDELGTLYQTRGMVYMVSGDAARASAAIAQSLIVDPGSEPIKALGPDFAKVHKSMAKVGLVQTVRVKVEGEGKALISGRSISPNSYVDVPAGAHLIQRQVGEAWTSEMVYITDGYTLSI